MTNALPLPTETITETAPAAPVTPSPQPPQPPKEEEMDEYGRMASERTIELSSQDAELVNNEVNDGRWKTYDDALHYVLTRGFAEIKRQREAARQLAEKTMLKAKRDQWEKLLSTNPKLIENQDLLQTMLKELGISKK